MDAALKWLRRRQPLGPLALERWQVLAAVVCLPLCAVNLSVAFFGSTQIFPLSPYFLKNKVQALGQYALHRPLCLVRGHPDVDDVVRSVEKEHGLPRGLLASVVEVESARRPHRISPAGAMGPAQLIPTTAEMMGVDDPYDTRQSIDGGARYLATQLRNYRSLPLAIAAYNAGPGSVRGSVPRNGETESYVRKVLAEYKRRRPARVAKSPAASRTVSAKGKKASSPAAASRVSTAPAGRRLAE